MTEILKAKWRAGEDDDDQVLHGHQRKEVVEKEREIQQEREREEKRTEK